MRTCDSVVLTLFPAGARACNKLCLKCMSMHKYTYCNIHLEKIAVQRQDGTSLISHKCRV